MKKITALALLASLQLSLTVPVFAIEADKTTQEKTKKVWFWNKKEEKIVKGNISYINFDWWNSFEDPILSEYIALAIDKNHDMKIATLATKEYYQNYKIQFGTELPQLQAGFMPGLAKAPGSSDTLGSFALPLIASYEVDIFLKNRDKTKSVQRMYEASLMDERAAHIAVASAVGTTYFNVVMLDEAIKLQEQIIAHRQEIYDLKLLSNKEGLVSTSDTIRANKALVHGQAELLELQKQREKALNQLAVLIGESPENIANLKRTDLNTLLISNKIPQSISSEVIENRPDYLKSAKMVEKAIFTINQSWRNGIFQ